jgi:hypothetical protein
MGRQNRRTEEKERDFPGRDAKKITQVVRCVQWKARKKIEGWSGRGRWRQEEEKQ